MSGLPQAVLFDLDGTLVDSVPDIADALGDLMEEHALPRHPRDAVMRMIGHGVPVLVERAFAAHGRPLAGEALFAAVKRYLDLYEPRATRLSRPFPGVEPAVRALAAAGVRVGVCTNKPTAVSRAMIAHYGLSDVLAVVVGGDFGPPRKPAPDLLLAALDLLGADPHLSVMVGDSGADVAAARAAGIGIIVVEYGYTAVPPGELGADAVVSGFGALEAALRRLREG